MHMVDFLAIVGAMKGLQWSITVVAYELNAILTPYPVKYAS